MATGSEGQRVRVGVFTALAWESAAVRAGLWQVTRVEKRVWHGILGTSDVLVVTAGIGPRQAQLTLDRFTHQPLAAVVSAGCAGGLVPGLSAGQVVLAPEVLMPGRGGGQGLTRFPVDPALLARARAAAARAGVSVVEGPLLTSPRVLFTPEDKARQQRGTGAVAVEMESGVHAAFAAARGLPFLTLRVILDPAEVGVPGVAGLTTPAGGVRPLKAAAYVATHPHELPRLLALRRAQAAAARSLTALCRSLFSAAVGQFVSKTCA